MASKRSYAYYLRGNQIALVEEGLGAGVCSLSGYSNQTTCEAAGGTWTENATGTDDGEYRSPTASITDGLEIEYAYSPRYMLETETINANKFFINGWTVINGYLTLLRQDYSSGGGGAHINFTGSPISLSDGDYILVKGSERWNGLHKVQINASYPGTESALTTYTKAASIFPYYENQDIDTNVDEEIFDGGGANSLWLANYFAAGDYIWLSGFTNEQACGLFKVGSVSASDTATSSKITVDAKYFVQSDGQPLSSKETEDGYPIDEEIALTGDSLMVANSGESDINIYGAQRDFCSISTGVNVMNDESDTIDLPEYLAKALVYYVKAKMAEDQGDMEGMAYNDAQFRSLMNRYENSRIWGSRRIAPGIGAIR